MVLNFNEHKPKTDEEVILDRFMKAYEHGYIGECRELGQLLKLTPDEIEYYVTEVTCAKREELGITVEEEIDAGESVDNLIYDEFDEDILTVYLPHDKWITVTDRLYGIYKSLILVTPEKTFLFGSIINIKKVHKELGGELQQTFGLDYWLGNSEVTEIRKLLK